MKHYYSLSNILERFIASRIAKKTSRSYHEVLHIRATKRKRKRRNYNLEWYVEYC
jgi:hypothetical protein